MIRKASLLGEVVDEALAVIGRMQQTVDVIEQVFLADFFARIGGLEMREALIRDRITAGEAAWLISRSREKAVIGLG